MQGETKIIPQAIQFKTSTEPVEYLQAVAFMEAQISGIVKGSCPEMVWFLEHPPLYTAGTSAKENDLLDKHRFPVFKTGRGGEYTYHGYGQRIAYVMLNLNKRTPDIKKYVNNLEQWIINTLERLGIKGERRKDRIGIWVIDNNGDEAKIAAIGIRVRKWVTYHGIALNVSPNLEHYSGIIPCGISSYGVTSLANLGIKITMKEVDMLLQEEFEKIF